MGVSLLAKHNDDKRKRSYKMKVLFRKKTQILAKLLLATLMISMFSMNVKAAEKVPRENNDVQQLNMLSGNYVEGTDNIKVNAKTMLYNCFISVNSSVNGMRVSFMTDCSQLASSVGVKDIIIKQRVWYGWKTVATSSGGSFSNAYAYTGSILYTNAIKGEEYRITCTHYADADEYVEVHGELDVIFTY